MKEICFLAAVVVINAIACNDPIPRNDLHPVQAFSAFETRFLDLYWKQYPSSSIAAGYGRYYENLVIPDSSMYAGNVAFSKEWLDSLNMIDFLRLSDNDKISFNIIKNWLQSDAWYKSVFNTQQWDASSYNVSNDCYNIIHQPWAPLDKRLKTLSDHLEKTGMYYQAALRMLYKPTRESVGLSLSQNLGGLSIFGSDLSDSIKSSQLTDAEVAVLNQNVAKTVSAINTFIDSLKAILVNKNYTFRNFPIGKKLYKEKFNYDLAINIGPEELYKKAMADKKTITEEMVHLADSLWPKYFQNNFKPKNHLALIQSVVNAISLHHANGKDFYDSLKSQVYELKRFIAIRNLFDFDTTYPIIVRFMPDYERGVTIANAEFTPPYQQSGDTYFNIDDVTKYTKERMESTLREYNNYASQFLSIHEAMPGHCLQGIYNMKKSPDVLRSVFQNGAMIEGWAVYTETMMLENGWAGNSAEIQLMHDKLKLRELGNVLIDYQMQCLDSSKESIMSLLINELFQTKAQAEEKYHRATLSQVQLCSYYAGASAIMALREEYKSKMRDKYSLKDFHENFLKYGSSPVKYIRERMLQ